MRIRSGISFAEGQELVADGEGSVVIVDEDGVWSQARHPKNIRSEEYYAQAGLWHMCVRALEDVNAIDQERRSYYGCGHVFFQYVFACRLIDDARWFGDLFHGPETPTLQQMFDVFDHRVDVWGEAQEDVIDARSLEVGRDYFFYALLGLTDESLQAPGPAVMREFMAESFRRGYQPGIGKIVSSPDTIHDPVLLTISGTISDLRLRWELFHKSTLPGLFDHVEAFEKLAWSAAIDYARHGEMDGLLDILFMMRRVFSDSKSRAEITNDVNDILDILAGPISCLRPIMPAMMASWLYKRTVLYSVPGSADESICWHWVHAIGVIGGLVYIADDDHRETTRLLRFYRDAVAEESGKTECAVVAWILCAKRMGVNKDVRRIISRRVWRQCDQMTFFRNKRLVRMSSSRKKIKK